MWQKGFYLQIQPSSFHLRLCHEFLRQMMPKDFNIYVIIERTVYRKTLCFGFDLPVWQVYNLWKLKLLLSVEKLSLQNMAA